MGPRQAAYALKLIRSKYVFPGHFGTFPLLTGTPDELRRQAQELGGAVEVLALKPAGSIS